MKLRLLPKFILSLGAVALVLTVAVSLFSYQTTRSYLQELYAERVMTNVKAVAAMLPADDVRAVLAEGGEQSAQYAELSELFCRLKRDGEASFVSLVVPDEDSVCFYIDAFVEEMGDDPDARIAYGTDILYTDAANPDDPADLENYLTAWQLFSQSRNPDAPLITDNDYGYNYTGLAFVFDETGTAIAEVQYILDMRGVRAYLNSFLVQMLLISFAIIGVTIVAYVFFVRKTVTEPVGRLAEFTREITDSGEFENRSIRIRTGDEIESLSESFNFMLAQLEIHIANLSKINAEKERISAELDIARHIQASMLPCIFPAFPEREDFDIHACMTPAKEVGGDFYDFFMVDERHLAVVMADVSGKGVPAALFMVIGKTLIKDHTTPGTDLGEVFSTVNDLLCESNSEGLFITAFEGVLDLQSGELRYVNAGHELPFVCHAGGEFEAVRIRPGFVLAGMENMRYRSGVMTLRPGDKLFQYTDGVTEATDAQNRLYGMQRLGAALNAAKNAPPAEILEAVKRDIDEFTGDAPQFDDITMLCLAYKGQAEEKEGKRP